MDADSFPIEPINQYIDSYGNVYVALDIENKPDAKAFVDATIREIGLDRAVLQYAYIPMKLIDRLLVQTKKVDYDARVTNNFHIMKAKLNDESYKLNLQNIYTLKEEKDPLVVSLNTSNVIINENEGIGITPNDKRSEEPIMIKQVKNWHPNKDANGNYMSAQQMSNYANYLNSVTSSPYYGQSYLSNTGFQYPF